MINVVLINFVAYRSLGNFWGLSKIYLSMCIPKRKAQAIKVGIFLRFGGNEGGSKKWKINNLYILHKKLHTKFGLSSSYLFRKLLKKLSWEKILLIMIYTLFVKKSVDFTFLAYSSYSSSY